MVAKVATFSFNKEIYSILFVLVLSSKEKEAIVIDLLNKNYTLREVAKMAHVSFSFISKIRKKIAGEELVDVDEGSQVSKPLSISSQAFQLFQAWS
ncbi:MAG: hypothetical protein ABJB76_06550 [Candidatus Nitrosocosmicus sp.]